MSIASATNLHKSYLGTPALVGFDLRIEPGEIIGLIGPNGSGKTTALQALLGLNSVDQGTLRVHGLNPQTHRHHIMRNTAYIADTGTLPRWMRVTDLLKLVDGTHPGFDLTVALEALANTQIQHQSRVRALSKGMQVQLHLAIVLAIDADLLVLDEPTLGLDILHRQAFYDRLINGYFSQHRSIVITTHEVREIEHLLTQVVFIHQGKVCLNAQMQDLPHRFIKVTSSTPELALDAQPLAVTQRRQGYEMIFDGIDPQRLSPHGELSTPDLTELFVALVGPAQSA